jgi:hypothetical protein
MKEAKVGIQTLNFLTVAILFNLLQRQVLTLHDVYASLKKEAKEGVENSSNFCPPRSCLTYSYDGK